MEKKTYKSIWIMVQAILLIVPIMLVLWYTPYQISHDQHMVDTVNERALEFEQPNGTITDFALAEIMENDALLEYEERVWKLEHTELYWFHSLIVGTLGAIALQLLNVIWYRQYNDMYNYQDDDDDDDFSFDD